jgi:hypothetical protein
MPFLGRLPRDARFRHIRFHYADLMFLAGAAGIVVAGAVYNIQAITLTIAVFIIGSLVTYAWFRNAKPGAPVRSLQAGLFMAISLGCAVISIAGVILFLKDGWHWWWALLIFPAWMAHFCFRFATRGMRAPAPPATDGARHPHAGASG